MSFAVASAEMYLATLDALADGVIVADATGQAMFCNAIAQALLPGGIGGLGPAPQGLSYRILAGDHRPLAAAELPLTRLLAGHSLQQEALIVAIDHHSPAADAKDSDVQDTRAIDHGPTYHPVLCNGRPLVALGAGVVLITLQPRPIGLSPLDDGPGQPLYNPRTGLPNPPLLMDRLSHALARGNHHTPTLMALLVIHLENPAAGGERWAPSSDGLLVEVAARLQRQAPDGATITTLGTDEFVVLLESVATSTSAIDLAEQMRQAIQQPLELPSQGDRPASVPLTLDARLGIALGPGLYQSAADWLRDAQAAADHLKSSPNQQHWHVSENTLRANPDLRLQTEIDLRRAINRGELRLHYQPIVTINTQVISGFEALVRWQHPTRGLLLPGEFIHIAEATGLIIPLGWWVLTEACRQMQAWTTQYPAMADFTVSVNMSSKQFAQPHLVESIQQILAETGFSAHRLKIEITEGVLIDHSHSIIATLEQLKALGIKLLVDDFGTGYSSLSYLHRFPFDCLKIDRSFIENADQDFEKLEILQSVVRLAWNLGLDVVAEGIETPRHHAQLKALRCELGQGYLFSRPLAPEGVEIMMLEKQQPTLLLPVIPSS
jgi:EAL domain-containing protein (putative c-di-GMP-specific phosphodiesterase class I)/GGDEF domain-containing protein